MINENGWYYYNYYNITTTNNNNNKIDMIGAIYLYILLWTYIIAN